MDRKLGTAGAFFGLTAVVLGAFGAHALKKILSAEDLQVFETGVKYQMYHALFLLLAAALPMVSEKSKKMVLWLTGCGILLFSGSIYLLSTGLADGFRFIAGPATPVGGTLLICSWAVLFFAFFRQKS